MVDLENHYTSNLYTWTENLHRVSEFAQQTALQYYNMLVSSHAAHDCQIRSNFYNQTRNTGTDFECTETKGDVLMETSGKYDFKMTL
jgi:hypothetical protein